MLFMLVANPRRGSNLSIVGKVFGRFWPSACSMASPRTTGGSDQTLSATLPAARPAVATARVPLTAFPAAPATAFAITVDPYALPISSGFVELSVLERLSNAFAPWALRYAAVSSGRATAPPIAFPTPCAVCTGWATTARVPFPISARPLTVPFASPTVAGTNMLGIMLTASHVQAGFVKHCAWVSGLGGCPIVGGVAADGCVE